MAEYDHVPGLELQLTRPPRPLPRLTIDPGLQSLTDIKPLLEASTEEVMRHFVLTGYDPHPAINFKVAV
jgi:thymidylate synthase